jgi:rubrerythrin
MPQDTETQGPELRRAVESVPRPAEEQSPQPVGIVERLTRDDSDRKRFLKMVGAGGAASFGAFVLAACGSSSTSSTATKAAATAASTTSTNKGDVAILNYALTLEYLETEFYAKVIAAKLFSGKVGALVKSFGAQEASHVVATKGAVEKLGGTPAAKPEGKFPIMNANQVAELAYTVENLGAAAYLGQAANIQSPEVLASALAIHSVEARHAASFGTLVKKPITPDGAFAKPADMATVLAAVKPFLA